MMSALKNFTEQVDNYHKAVDELVAQHKVLETARAALISSGVEGLGLGAMPLNREIKKTKLLVWTPGQIADEKEEGAVVDAILKDGTGEGSDAPAADAGNLDAAQ